MSSKSDSDNRSNQLNSNNSAYHSSRGSSGSDDDDEDTYRAPSSYRRTYEAESFRNRNGSSTRTETFAFGAVSMDGRAIYRTATFEAPGAVLGRNAARIQLEEYLNGFETLARLKLASSFGSSTMAIFAVFDPTESCLGWHVPLMQHDLQKTRASIAPRRLSYLSDRLRPAPSIEKQTYLMLEAMSPGAGKKAEEKDRALASDKLDPLPFLEALRAAVTEDAQSWGVFNVPDDGYIGSAVHRDVLKQLNEV